MSSPARKADLFSEIKRKNRRWRLFKIPFEGNMFLNVAFYYGYQWTVYNIVTAELTPLDNPTGRIRITSNQIQPRIRNLHAKMRKNKPIMEVLPENWSDRSVFSAAASKKLLEHFSKIHCEDKKDAETIDWLLLCGDAFRKIGFDPDEGEQLKEKTDRLMEYMGDNPESGFPQYQEQLMPTGEYSSIPMGELFDDVVPPFEIQVPEYATSLDNALEFQHEKLVPISDFREKWGRRATNIAPDTDLVFGDNFQQRLLGMASPDTGSSIGVLDGQGGEEPLVRVIEHWRKPSKRYPRGRMTILGGNSPDGIVYDEDNPFYEVLKKIYSPSMFPMVHYRCIQGPGKFWSISPVEAMRPLQVEYNKSITDIVMNRATVGRNKIFAPKTAKIDPDEITNQHGQFIEYSGMVPPSVFPAVPLPQQVERETERNRLDLDTISGSHEVSRAEVPSGVKSGIAINYLLEQDDTTLAPIIQNYEIAREEQSKLKLGIAQAFYTEERVIAATGDDELGAFHFMGSDLCINVRVVPGSALPQSRAALQATYIDLWDRKAIIDDQGMPDARRLFQLLRSTMPIEAFAEEENLDLSRARKENYMLMAGQEILPKPWENQLVHWREHNRFMKTEQFYKLPQQIQRNFMIHLQFTRDLLAPPTPTPGAELVVPAMLGQKPGSNGQSGPARISPSFMGQGVGGALQSPPGNMG